MRHLPTPLVVLLAVSGCGAPRVPEVPTLHYVGSSTIANFLRDADEVCTNLQFELETEPESTGGELAIVEGRADLAGVARLPAADTLAHGVSATLIGLDEIAVLVHPENPVRDLSLAELRGIFAGRIVNWREVGGEDLKIRVLLVGPSSATRYVFRSVALGAEDYGPSELVSPDSKMPARVASDRSAIGPISFSFLENDSRARAITVEGQAPSHTNDDYPITRPLYLLWWRGRARVAEFIEWTDSPEGREIFARRFTLIEDSP